MVNGMKIDKPTPVYIGDTVAVGSTVLVMQKADRARKARASWFFDGREQKTSASPVTLLFLTSLLHFILVVTALFCRGRLFPRSLSSLCPDDRRGVGVFPGFPAGVSPRQL